MAASSALAGLLERERRLGDKHDSVDSDATAQSSALEGSQLAHTARRRPASNDEIGASYTRGPTGGMLSHGSDGLGIEDVDPLVEGRGEGLSLSHLVEAPNSTRSSSGGTRARAVPAAPSLDGDRQGGAGSVLGGSSLRTGRGSTKKNLKRILARRKQRRQQAAQSLSQSVAPDDALVALPVPHTVGDLSMSAPVAQHSAEAGSDTVVESEPRDVATSVSPTSHAAASRAPWPTARGPPRSTVDVERHDGAAGSAPSQAIVPVDDADTRLSYAAHIAGEVDSLVESVSKGPAHLCGIPTQLLRDIDLADDVTPVWRDLLPVNGPGKLLESQLPPLYNAVAAHRRLLSLLVSGVPVVAVDESSVKPESPFAPESVPLKMLQLRLTRQCDALVLHPLTTPRAGVARGLKLPLSSVACVECSNPSRRLLQATRRAAEVFPTGVQDRQFRLVLRGGEAVELIAADRDHRRDIVAGIAVARDTHDLLNAMVEG